MLFFFSLLAVFVSLSVLISLLLLHSSSPAPSGYVEIGTPGADIYIGTAENPADLIFKGTSSITSEGSHAISVGTSGNTVNLNVPGVTYNYSNLQMRDQATNQIYCIWIENGEWQKAKGECKNIK